MSEKDVSEKDIPLGLEKLHEDLLLLNEVFLGEYINEDVVEEDMSEKNVSKKDVSDEAVLEGALSGQACQAKYVKVHDRDLPHMDEE